jgi:hypothetical protein
LQEINTKENTSGKRTGKIFFMLHFKALKIWINIGPAAVVSNKNPS